MKVWVLLLWLLLLHPLNAFEMCEEHGNVRLRGRNGANLTAGRIEICIGTNWRSVCTDYWGRMDAKVLCRQLGFPEGGEEYFAFGWEGNGGLYNFTCSGNETKLINCTYRTLDNRGCTYAGVACRTVVTLLEVATVREEMGTDQVKEVYICTPLTGGLGALVVVMAIGLVGVVLGWVWSCHRKRGKSPIKERPTKVDENSNQTNPSHSRGCLLPTGTSKTHPSGEQSETEIDENSRYAITTSKGEQSETNSGYATTTPFKTHPSGEQSELKMDKNPSYSTTGTAPLKKRPSGQHTFDLQNKYQIV